jgi:hypothetical protein
VHFARNLLALIPKAHQDMVAALFRTIFAPIDAASVEAQWDQFTDTLAPRWPKAAGRNGPHEEVVWVRSRRCCGTRVTRRTNGSTSLRPRVLTGLEAGPRRPQPGAPPSNPRQTPPVWMSSDSLGQRSLPGSLAPS